MANFNKKLSLIIKAVSILLVGLLIYAGGCFWVLREDARLNSTYESAIQCKFEKLKSTDEPKIIIIGGSNAGFGINSDLLEKETGYAVVNMGLHGGFGQLFNTEIARNYINDGDIVILAYEYGISDATFEKFGDLDLIMVGLNGNLSMYKELPLKNIPEVLGNIPSYFEYKTEKKIALSSVYSINSFDEHGNMIYTRDSSAMPDYEDNIDEYGGLVYGDTLLSEDNDFEYLVKLRRFIEKRGATVYFAAPVLLKDAYIGTDENLVYYYEQIEKATGIKCISNPSDYLFPMDHMYDTIYHCNDLGEKTRTERLANDLKRNGIVD